MSQILYKYMPFRKEFFNNFLLRASQRSAFNDPFDSTPSIEYLADVCMRMRYTRCGKTHNEIKDYLTRVQNSPLWSEAGLSIWKENGIICFSETRSNLCMWSHYAKEHSGMVVGFNSEVLANFLTEKLDDTTNKPTIKFHRVKYRTERWSEDFTWTKEMEDLPNKKGITLGLDLLHPYKHKSIEWAYEQEYRLMLPLIQADEFWDGENKNLLIDRHTANSIGLENNSNILALYQVPKNAISSITFGCNSNLDNRNHIINLINNNNELKHINMFQAEKDLTDYKLKFNKLQKHEQDI